MADKNWQAGGMNLILAQAVVCLAAGVAPSRAAQALSGKFSPASYLGNPPPPVDFEITKTNYETVFTQLGGSLEQADLLFAKLDQEQLSRLRGS